MKYMRKERSVVFFFLMKFKLNALVKAKQRPFQKKKMLIKLVWVKVKSESESRSVVSDSMEFSRPE